MQVQAIKQMCVMYLLQLNKMDEEGGDANGSVYISTKDAT